MKVCTPFLLTLLFFSVISEGPSEAQPLQALSAKVKQQQRRAGGNLRESQVLLENDSLFPTQSRTQAMSLETETGHLTPEEDAVLLPILRRRPNQQAVRVKPQQRHRPSGPLIRNY